MTSLQANTLREESFAGGGGFQIFVRSWRPETAVSGVVVIVPGFNSHGGYYGWTAEQLMAKGLAVFALDLRGRGKSDGERFYVDKFSDYTSDVASLLEIVREREPGLPVFLLGHSAGGVVSCLYALEHQAEPPTQIRAKPVDGPQRPGPAPREHQPGLGRELLDRPQAG